LAYASSKIIHNRGLKPLFTPKWANKRVKEAKMYAVTLMHTSFNCPKNYF